MIRKLISSSPVIPAVWAVMSVAALAGLAAPTPVIAQVAQEDANSMVLDEIIVTARRRTENLQEVPLAVTALQGEALERRDLGDISALGDLAPNVTFKSTASLSGASNASAFFIRGVGQTDFAVTTDPGVGTYLDGVYVARSVGGVLDTLDVESVEVLRGPQGTLFGRNTIGGAINVRSRRPGNEFGGEFALTAGERSRRQLAAALDLPLSDTLKARVSFLSKKQDGYVRRLVARDNGGRLVGTGDKANAGTLSDSQGNVDTSTVRAALDWSPNDAWNLYLSIDSTRVREESAASTAAISSAGAVPASALPPIEVPGLGIVAPGDPRLVTGDPDTTYATGPNGTHLDIDGATLIATREWNDIEIESITAWRATEGAFNRDGDGTPFPAGEQTRTFDYEQFSQEFKLSGGGADARLDWTAGLYYLNEDAVDLVFVSLGNLFGPPPSIDIDNFVDNKSFAAYAQIGYAVSERLGLTGGLRWTRDDKSYATSQVIPVIPLVVVDGASSKSFDAITGRLGFEYSVSDRHLLYVSAARGFKSGGFTPRYVNPVPAPLPFDEETVTTWEVGSKWESANGRARINAAAFRSRYDDIQLVLFDTFGAPINQNGGDATISGLELEAQVTVAEGLDLTASLGWLDAGFNEVLPPTALPFQPITEDSRFPNSPEFQATISPELVRPVPGGTLSLRLDWLYSSRVHQTFENDPELLQGAYHLLDASVSYEQDSDNWSVTFGVHNLSDKRIIVSGGIGRVPGFGDVNYNPPREWFLALRKSF